MTTEYQHHQSLSSNPCEWSKMTTEDQHHQSLSSNPCEWSKMTTEDQHLQSLSSHPCEWSKVTTEDEHHRSLSSSVNPVHVPHTQTTVMPYNYTIPRGPIGAMYSSPGPCYTLPGLCGHINQAHDPRSVHSKKPAYSFGFRTPLMDKQQSPGPKYFPNPKIYRDGLDGTPHYSLGSRRPPLHPFPTPGPGTYRPEKCFPSSGHPTAPAYSLHDRTALSSKFKTPAPNTYTLPPVLGVTVESTKRAGPVYSMQAKNMRGGFSEDLAKAPGPGTYNETDASLYKRRLPHYSMAARVYPPGDRTNKPGPGAHRPEDCKNYREYPSYTFGLRHSPYISVPIMEPPE